MKESDLKSIRTNYDRIVHLLEEAKLPRSEVVEQAKSMFPDFSDQNFYDKVIGPYEIEVYMDSRGKGLSVEESAHNAEISNFVLNQALQGQGLSLERFVALVKAELFAKSKLIINLLNVIEKAESNTEVNAATILLEKIAPERYGKAVSAVSDKTAIENTPVSISFTVREEDEH
jgi:hypothetical protein